MGGRGGSSHAARAGRAGCLQDFAHAETMANSLQVNLDTASMLRHGINPIYVEETLTAVAAIYKAFPSMVGRVQYLDAEELSSMAYASAGGDGGLHMGLYGRMSPSDLKNQWAIDIASGWHPKGTTSAGIFVHEMGHQIESYLNGRDYFSPWGWGKTADSVILAAAKKLDASITYIHSPEVYKLAADISRYAVNEYNARTNTWETWETLAEAVSDYYENGSNAKPLSREIWKELMRRMK